MKVFCLLLLVALAHADVNESEKDFEKEFNILENDEAEKADEGNLKAAEDEINKNNNDPNSSYKEKLNPLSDMSKEDMEKEKMGLKEKPKDARSLSAEVPFAKGLKRRPPGPNSPESEAYLKEFYMRMARASVPDSYDSKAKGLVTPARNQQTCGSCAAFAATAVHETCMLGVGAPAKGMDLSEQYIIDCGYDGNGMAACDGAWAGAYTEWFATKGGGTAPHEVKYPYLDRFPKKNCNANPAKWSSGAKVTKGISDYGCSEDKLKALVAQHGSAVTTIAASAKAFQNYASGVFSGCGNDHIDHAVTVVGYGNEGGKDYWLVKNSWGNTWGDKGFIKIQRGVGMCKIGTECAVAVCEKDGVASPAPVAPPPPPVPLQLTCDISGIWGPGITGNYNLRYKKGGNTYDSQVKCTNSVCQPRMAGPSNACLYICGSLKCGN